MCIRDRGKVVLNIIDLDTGKSLVELEKNIGDLVNNDYTEFKTNLQLTKKKEYSIQPVSYTHISQL